MKQLSSSNCAATNGRLLVSAGLAAITLTNTGSAFTAGKVR